MVGCRFGFVVLDRQFGAGHRAERDQSLQNGFDPFGRQPGDLAEAAQVRDAVETRDDEPLFWRERKLPQVHVRVQRRFPAFWHFESHSRTSPAAGAQPRAIRTDRRKFGIRLARPATLPVPMDRRFISVEGARQNNLRNVSVRVPLGAVTAVTGVAGAGKSSLAFDVLHAEGYRRYVETFSPYARQFLERLDRPPAHRIDGRLPSLALAP